MSAIGHWGLILLLSLGCGAAILFYGYAMIAAIDFFTTSDRIDPAFQPAVTILKPVCGDEWQLYENLSSFCQQDYPTYQVIVSVQNAADPAIATVKRLIQAFPETDVELVISDQAIGINPKVNNLANGSTAAKHAIWILADSDIRVRPDYIRQVIQPLCDPQVGVVTCPYRSQTQGWLAAFEALEISTQFHPRVLTARKLAGDIDFAFGSTIVIRQTVLEQMGGFAAIADALADDFQLGHQPAQQGVRVVLSPYIVDHSLSQVTLQTFLQRQIRWAKCIRVGQFWGYVGLIFTQGTVLSLLLLWATGGAFWSWIVLLLTWTLRLTMAWLIGIHYLHDPIVQRGFVWIPLRDLVAFLIWCWGFVGDRIEWRGQVYRLTPDGQLVADAT